MAAQRSVIATCDPSVPNGGGDNLSVTPAQIRAAAGPKGVHYIEGYDGRDDLIGKLRVLLAPDDCLRYLEILGHGSAQSCDDVWVDPLFFIPFANGLKSLNLCGRARDPPVRGGDVTTTRTSTTSPQQTAARPTQRPARFGPGAPVQARARAGEAPPSRLRRAA